MGLLTFNSVQIGVLVGCGVWERRTQADRQQDGVCFTRLCTGAGTGLWACPCRVSWGQTL